MKKILVVLCMIALVFCFSSCADSAQASNHIYGFWGGLWHGIIAPFDFIGMLFSKNVAVYAPNNNGCWYAFGFLWGVGAWAGGSSVASKR